MIKQLELSIPNEISIEHILHQLLIDDEHDLKEYPYDDNVIVTNKHDEFYPPNLDNAISELEKQNVNWKSILYDVTTYHRTESHITHSPTMDTLNNIKLNKTRSIQWTQYLNKKSSDHDESIALSPQHKIMDSILGYHHYTIAVSHIINVYHILKTFKISLVFMMHKRYPMHDDIEDIASVLQGEDIAYISQRMNGFHLNETIKILFNAWRDYRNIATGNRIILLVQFESCESSECTMYIYNAQSSIVPHIADNDACLFIVQFQCLHDNNVKCYWKIDGKTLRFFPEHMETVWPYYFQIESHDINKLIYHHKYRHQFGVGLYDAAFCTLYYAITHRRFISTHYYRKYRITNKLTLGLRSISVNDIDQKEYFIDLLNDTSPQTDDAMHVQTTDDFPVYDAVDSDTWLSPDNAPKFKNMKEELLKNAWNTMTEYDYMDIEIECQIWHQNKEENVEIISRQELIALRVFTEYHDMEIQGAFSRCYYDNHSVDIQDRRSQFYRWNIVLKQVMQYAAKPCSNTMWRGLNRCFELQSLVIHAIQPTTFLFDKEKASVFCRKDGIILESSCGVLGIPLRWSQEDEYIWWCMNTTFRVQRIYITTNDIKQRIHYLRNVLLQMKPMDRDTFNRFEVEGVTDDDMKQYVIEMLDFEEKEGMILQENELKHTLLQFIFFELKQYHILECIWNPQVDDIEICNDFQTIYLWQHKLFVNMDKYSDSYVYREYIMNVMKKRDEALSMELLLRQIFIDLVRECMDEYNIDSKNALKINEKQRESVINYLTQNEWNVHEFVKNDYSKEIKSIFIKEFRKRSPANKLYTIIKNKIVGISGSARSGVSFGEFYYEFVKYKQMEKCNTLQLMYILEKHIFPNYGSNMDELCMSGIKEYIEMHQLNGHSFLLEKQYLDVHEAIKQWQTDIIETCAQSQTILDYKLRNTNYNAFHLLIGECELEIINDVFQIKLNEKQQHLLFKNKPVFILILNEEKEIQSSNTSFTIDIETQKILHKTAVVQYRISFKFHQYQLMSSIKSLSLSSQGDH